ncbi:MAG: fimbria/pilus periplasmic chaperone, partial [Sphingomonas sp.]
AMRVSPMVIEMTSKGSGATARLEVQNLNDTQLAYETRITRIDYDANGNMVETPADGDFLVFPPQGVLPPKQRQVIRLQWLGDQDMKSSRGYYVSVNQLPVKLDPQTDAQPAAEVQVVYHMKALVVVAPPNAKPEVSVASAKPVMIEPRANPGSDKPAEGAPQPGVEVTVTNTGARYAMMAGANWVIQGKDTSGKPLTVTLNRDDLNRQIGAGYVEALKGRRTFRVTTGTAFGTAPIKVQFN